MKTAPTTGVDGYLATDSHNLWLTAWAETGFLGLLLTLAYHVLLARALWLRSVDGSWVAQGALLSFLGFHLLSLVHYLPYHTGVYLTFSFVWGLGLAPDPALSVEPVPGKAPAAAPPSIAA